MRQKPNGQIFVDGKPVRCWLFCRMSALGVGGARHPVLYQVEGFSLDHAFERLTNEIAPGFARREFEMLDELDPEHFVGELGTYHPLKNVFVPFSPQRH